MKPLYWFGPLVILLIAGGIVWLVTSYTPEPEKEVREKSVPSVSVVAAEAEPRSLTVVSQGNVQPRTETLLTPEVSGRIVMVADSFRAGGLFEEGELLVKIDDFDYQVALERARAQLARSRLTLAEERAAAEQARRDWEALGKGEPSDLVLRKPQLERARADVSSDVAAVREARRNLERTEVRAPYRGRVLEKFVDVGQYVSAGPGSQLARIFSVEKAEVRLPLSKDQIALLDLRYQEGRVGGNAPAVTVATNFGDRRFTWEGTIERVEGAVDERTRFFYLVAVVDEPYADDPEQPGRPPLKPGMFVEAEIEGRDMGELYAVPRSAMYDTNTLLAVDREGKLRHRNVEVVQGLQDSVLVRSGIEPGDRLMTSQLTYPIDGMEVSVANARPAIDPQTEAIASEPEASIEAPGTVAREDDEAPLNPDKDAG
jgi:RND family efflux transporter MFP subunit